MKLGVEDQLSLSLWDKPEIIDRLHPITFSMPDAEVFSRLNSFR